MGASRVAVNPAASPRHIPPSHQRMAATPARMPRLRMWPGQAWPGAGGAPPSLDGARRSMPGAVPRRGCACTCTPAAPTATRRAHHDHRRPLRPQGRDPDVFRPQGGDPGRRAVASAHPADPHRMPPCGAHHLRLGRPGPQAPGPRPRHPDPRPRAQRRGGGARGLPRQSRADHRPRRAARREPQAQPGGWRSPPAVRSIRLFDEVANANHAAINRLRRASDGAVARPPAR